MAPGGAKSPEGDLQKSIDHSFGSYQNFKEAVYQSSPYRFGSGWAWLVKQGDSLVISSTPNQDNPLMDLAEVKGFRYLGVDVWEHAYYLKYQNRRPDYVDAFFNVVNWDEVADGLKLVDFWFFSARYRGTGAVLFYAFFFPLLIAIHQDADLPCLFALALFRNQSKLPPNC